MIPECRIPDDLEFKTKPQLTVELLQEISQQALIPFRYVVANSIYGNSPEFIQAVEGIRGVTYFVSMPNDTLCWLKNPVILHLTKMIVR